MPNDTAWMEAAAQRQITPGQQPSPDAPVDMSPSMMDRILQFLSRQFLSTPYPGDPSAAQARTQPRTRDVEANYRDIQGALRANPSLGIDERDFVPGKSQYTGDGMIPDPGQLRGASRDMERTMQRPNLRYGRPYREQEAYGVDESENTPGYQGYQDRGA